MSSPHSAQGGCPLAMALRCRSRMVVLRRGVVRVCTVDHPPASLGHPPWLVLCPPGCCVDPLGESHRLVDLVRRHLSGPLEPGAGDGEGLGADAAGGVDCGERGSTEHAYGCGSLARLAAL